MAGEDRVIDRNQATLGRFKSIPGSWVDKARSGLHIAYGHTSHGSQLTEGMSALAAWRGSAYAVSAKGAAGALDLRHPIPGAGDLGNPDRKSWAAATRAYLAAHPECNVIIWSWCGQVSSAAAAEIEAYLDLMSGLEADYPKVSFVYMTGHLNGTGQKGNLNQRNEQIRAYCRANGKWLYDFADIESYDPDQRTNYMPLLADDNCDYDSDGNGSSDRNWAKAWMDTHKLGADWFLCSAAHSQALNGNQKAYAAWWLWARLAGWDGI